MIQFVKRAARGFRDTGYFETMIFLRLGRLDFSAQLAVSSVTRQKQRRALIKGLVSSKIESRKLSELRNALLPGFMSGEMDVGISEVSRWST